jgi:hypothetical protein
VFVVLMFFFQVNCSSITILYSLSYHGQREGAYLSTSLVKYHLSLNTILRLTRSSKVIQGWSFLCQDLDVIQMYFSHGKLSKDGVFNYFKPWMSIK